jgi:hypothetical protein
MFWEFDRLVEGGPQVEVEIVGSQPLFRVFFEIRVYVIGMGCQPMVLTMFGPIL